MKTYEAMMIFDASVRDEILDKALERIGGDLERAGGKVTETQKLGERSFARPMKKKECGQYVRMIIDLDPANVASFLGRCRLNEDIFRVQFTVREPPVPVAPAKAE